MAQIIIVVAMNENKVIGVDNQLPWHIPEDLQHFKQVTMNKPIIMGRKTFESIGRVLPGRPNLVISRNKTFNFPGIEVFESLDKVLSVYATKYPELCIIGGGEIFKQALPIANKLHLTIVKLPIADATTFFPEIDYRQWQLVSERTIMSVSNIQCVFYEYDRKC